MKFSQTNSPTINVESKYLHANVHARSRRVREPPPPRADAAVAAEPVEPATLCVSAGLSLRVAKNGRACDRKTKGSEIHIGRYTVRILREKLYTQMDT